MERPPAEGGQGLVGRAVLLFVPAQNLWVKRTVAAYDSKTQAHALEAKREGRVARVDLRKARYRVLGREEEELDRLKQKLALFELRTRLPANRKLARAHPPAGAPWPQENAGANPRAKRKCPKSEVGRCSRRKHAGRRDLWRMGVEDQVESAFSALLRGQSADAPGSLEQRVAPFSRRRLHGLVLDGNLQPCTRMFTFDVHGVRLDIGSADASAEPQGSCPGSSAERRAVKRAGAAAAAGVRGEEDLRPSASAFDKRLFAVGRRNPRLVSNAHFAPGTCRRTRPLGERSEKTGKWVYGSVAPAAPAAEAPAGATAKGAAKRRRAHAPPPPPAPGGGAAAGGRAPGAERNGAEWKRVDRKSVV